eukprot:2966136-Amphidinium_carterae.1
MPVLRTRANTCVITCPACTGLFKCMVICTCGFPCMSEELTTFWQDLLAPRVRTTDEVSR